MKLYRITIFLGAFFVLFSCNDKKTDSSDVISVQEQKTQFEMPETMKTTASADLLKIIANNTSRFSVEFKKLSSAEQYYFCAAFTMGAMSVSKPITASAMVNYFIGLGVVYHNLGINDINYRAFDFGKNVFHFEPVVNTILHEKICENIIGEALKVVKKKKISTQEINAIGRTEVRKIVHYIEKNK